VNLVEDVAKQPVVKSGGSPDSKIDSSGVMPKCSTESSNADYKFKEKVYFFLFFI